MKFQETKQRFIDFLYNRKYEKGEYFRNVDDCEYLTRCPYCGDSTHSRNTGHLYIKIDPKSLYKMVYYCQKCEHTGIVDEDLLELMGSTDEQLRNGIAELNRYGKIKKSADVENKFLYFDRVFPEEQKYPQKINYIKNRLLVNPSKEQLSDMKVITSLYDFLIQNKIQSSPFNKEVRMLLERDYIGFVSSGNSHILFRDVTEKNKYPWVKYPIEPDSKKNRVMYSYSDTINIFSKDTIVINLAEGIFDILGVTFHLMNTMKNTVNIAVGGRNFNTVIKYLITLGIVGSNVILNIYFDNDSVYNNEERTKNFTEKDYSYLYKYTPIFKEINYFRNLKNKDYGVPKDLIIVEKKRLKKASW